MALAKIMIIRHGEKPPRAGGPPFGIDEDGDQNADELIVQGWERAGALIPFFSPRDVQMANADLARPTAIFAAAPSGAGSSQRPKHTVKPLAAAMGLQENLQFSVGQEAALSTAVIAETGVVLICWEHHNIAVVVQELTNGAITSPHWPGDRFDMVLVLDPVGAGWTLKQVPQLLLAGDSSKPLS